MKRDLPGVLGPGPFTADQLRSKDPYELSNGHAILSPPTGQRGGKANLLGGEVLETDPKVESAGVDVGFSPRPKDMRAPDLAVGNVEDEPGWAKSAPPLAVEYADVGQDERALTAKIGELFDAGTRLLWVVRLAGPRHVEVHEPGKRMRIAKPGEELLAPGILANPVRVEALYDREFAHEATFRNLLQRRGYESLEQVRAKGVEEGIEKGIERGLEKGIEKGREEGERVGIKAALRAVLASRGLTLSQEMLARLEAEADVKTLTRWLELALHAETAGAVFEA